MYTRAIKNVLVFVAHADDETLGCGGYIPLLIKRGCRVDVLIASDGLLIARDGAPNNRPHVYDAAKVLGLLPENLYFLDLPDQGFEAFLIKDIVNKIKQFKFDPDMIITHSAGDLNRDHRIVHEAALVYGRSIDKRISLLGCEIPAQAEYFAGAFTANFYVNIEESIQLKQQAFTCYPNEIHPFPHPFSIEGIQTKAKQRGMEIGCNYAEGYRVIRWFD